MSGTLEMESLPFTGFGYHLTTERSSCASKIKINLHFSGLLNLCFLTKSTGIWEYQLPNDLLCIKGYEMVKRKVRSKKPNFYETILKLDKISRQCELAAKRYPGIRADMLEVSDDTRELSDNLKFMALRGWKDSSRKPAP